MLTHEALIELAKRLDIQEKSIQVSDLYSYMNSLNAGLCYGFTLMWAYAVLTDDEQNFNDRLELIDVFTESPPSKYTLDYLILIYEIETANKKKNNCQSDTNEQLLLTLPVFFKALLLNQSNTGKSLAVNYNQAIPIKLNNKDIIVAFNDTHAFVKPLFREIELENKIELHEISKFEAYLLDLAELFRKNNIEPPILLNTRRHTIGLKYHIDNEQWYCINTADLSRNYKSEKYKYGQFFFFF